MLYGTETQYNVLCSIGQFRKAVTKTHTGGNTTLHNTVRPRETTSHGFVTPDNHPVAYGRPRGTTGYHGRPRETTGDHGPGRCDLGNDSLAYGRPWETTEDHERPGETTGDHGRPRETTGHGSGARTSTHSSTVDHCIPQETTGDHVALICDPDNHTLATGDHGIPRTITGDSWRPRATDLGPG